MYPGYADYWRSVLSNPKSPENHLKFARLAEKTPHLVFSKILERADWRNTTIRKGKLEDEIRDLKRQPGKDMVAWGGASFAASLIAGGLVDQYQFVVNPVLLGGGKALFGHAGGRRSLKPLGAKSFASGAVVLRYANDRPSER
jgi:dihydrofolate reductase